MNAPPSHPRRLVLLLAAAVLLLSGCTGVPAGTAGTGDGVAVRYTLADAATGEVLRLNASTSFLVGSGSSGLGLPFEFATRGVAINDTTTTEYRYDERFDYSGVIEANRTLAPIQVHQSAPRADFEQFVGPATLGQVFPAYGIYDGVVTEVGTGNISFRIQAQDGQEDPVPSVGAVLVTHVGETELTRELRPIVGATFAIQPPSQFQPSTPLGLAPGSYKVLGATESKIQYAKSADPNHDLVGRTLRATITVLDIEEQAEAVPTGNFGVRASPQVNGDPNTALGGQAMSTSTAPASDGHVH